MLIFFCLSSKQIESQNFNPYKWAELTVVRDLTSITNFSFRIMYKFSHSRVYHSDMSATKWQLLNFIWTHFSCIILRLSHINRPFPLNLFWICLFIVGFFLVWWSKVNSFTYTIHVLQYTCTFKYANSFLLGDSNFLLG